MIAVLLVLLGYIAPQTASGSIAGQILDASGAPAASVRVAAMPVDLQAANVSVLAAISETDRTGRYRLENVEPGTYHLVAGRVDVPTFYPGVTAKENARTIAVVAGASLTGLDFRIVTSVNTRSPGNSSAPPAGPSYAITGNVILESGQRVPVGTRAVLSTTQSTPIRPDGSFQFDGVFPGTYQVRSSALFPSATMPVIVKDKDVAGIALKLPVTVRVDGIIETSGSPLNETVSLSIRQTTEPDYWVSISSAQTFALDLPEGEYGITPEKVPERYRVQSITAGSANLVSDILRVRRNESVRVRVVLATVDR
jgi:hypothetical protein